MNTKIIVMAIIGVLVIGGGSFYAGTKSAGDNSGPRADFAQMGPGGQVRMGQNEGVGMRAGQAGGMTMGEIISKNETSIVVKLPDGESKIVLFSGNTTITKSTTGSSTDLVVGEDVVVNGSTNSDGSIDAQSIQLGSGMQFRQNQNPPSAS